MHKRRTSKLARETRRKGDVREKRTSMAEEETTKEKESMRSPPAETVSDQKKATQKEARHSHPRSLASNAEEWPHGREARRS